MSAEWSDKFPPGYKVKKAEINRPREEDPCTCEFIFEKDYNAFEDTEMLLSYQWFVGGKIPMNFVPIQGAVGKVHHIKSAQLIYLAFSICQTDLLHKVITFLAKSLSTFSMNLEQEYWPRREDVGCCLKAECTLTLGETTYPPVFAVSVPVAPGNSS